MADEAVEDPTKFCPTCKQDVPSRNFEMHSIHCKRFLTPCPHCKESVNKKLLDEHIEEYHAKVKCEDCKEDVEKMDLESHKETTCRRRTLKCSYCEINLPACDMDEHKEPCGSRTEECDTCKQRILVKNLEQHISSGCQPPESMNESSGKLPTVATKTKNPESIYYDNQNQGFSIDHQFLSSRFTNHDETNSLFGAYMDFKPSYFPNGDVFESPNSGRSTLTSQSSSNSSPSLDHSPPKKSSIRGRGEMPLKKPSARKYNEDGSIRSKLSHKTSRDSEKVSNFQDLPAFGIPDPDSDDMGEEEKKPFPDLSDETFLPCEFCKESFPADALTVHQVICGDEFTPSPRPRLPQSFNTSSYDPISSFTPAFAEKKEEASGASFKMNKKDFGGESAPCEFCNEPIPLGDLAMHQVTCLENPHSSGSGPNPERSRRRSPSPPSKPDPKPSSTFSSSLTDSRSKSLPTENVSPSLRRSEAATNRRLAPTFSNKPTATQQEKARPSGARPKNKKTPVDDKEKRPKPGGGGLTNGRSRVKTSPSIPKTYHEVNVLGGEYSRGSTDLATHARKPGSQPKSGNPYGHRDEFSSAQVWNVFNGGTTAGGEDPWSIVCPPRNPAQVRTTRKPFNPSGTGQHVNFHGYSGGGGGGGGKKSHQANRGRQYTRGQTGGARTITITQRQVNERSESSSGQPLGCDGLSLYGQRFEERREGSHRGRGRGGRRPGGSGYAGPSRGGKSRNPRSPRGRSY